MTALAELAAAGRLDTDVPLATLTTYKFGGPARYFLEATGEDDLIWLGEAIRADAAAGVGHPVLVVGRGSNLVVADDGFPGIAVRLGAGFGALRFDDGQITAGGALPLPTLARRAVEAGLGGLEFYVGIPGAVGGAVVMNAGCFGTETADVLIEARIVDLRSGEAGWRTPEGLDLRYRHSNLGPAEVVVAGTFRSKPISIEDGKQRMRDITQWRRDNQPGGTFNAGSVFKNPPGDSAGRIIDSLGLKGFRVGGAAVSERHANFFVADPGTRAQDLHDLVAAVRRKVAAEAGIELEPEIRFAGDFRDTTKEISQ